MMKESQRFATVLFVLGFSAILVQIVVLREFLNVFNGNELIIGLIMAIWMLQTALGAWLERKVARSGMFMQFLFLFLPLLAVFALALMYILSILIFPPGVSKGLMPAFLFANIILLPFCISSGLLFSAFSHRLSSITRSAGINAGYGWESAGSALAGILSGTIFLHFFSSFSLLGWDILVHALLFLILFGKGMQAFSRFMLPAIVVIAGVFLCFRPPDLYLRSKVYTRQDMLLSRNTPFGNITVTNTSGQINYFDNGNFLFSTGNLALQEEMVHYVMLQCNNPHNVLVVSGGMARMQEQLSKYPTLKKVDYIEINPWLIQTEEMFSSFKHRPWFHVLTRDARTWIRNDSAHYDAVILNVPDPSTAQLNRYFTKEFFTDLSQILNRNGFLITSLESSGSYISEDAQKLYRLIYATLKSIFPYVEVLPGERNFFVAGYLPVHIDLVKRADSLGIQNDYVSSAYLDDRLLKLYNSQLMSVITVPGSEINKDGHPLAYLLQINFWLSSFKENRWILILFLLAAVILTLRKIDPISAAVLTGGFSGASAEFLVIMIFQTMYGLVYQMIGLIVAFYMAGLAAGSLYGWKFLRATRKAYVFVQFLLFVALIMVPLVNTFLSSHPDIRNWQGQLALLVMIFLVSMLTGTEFNLGNRLWMEAGRKTAISLYATDLSGSAIGLLLTSLWIFPMFGLYPACQIAAGLNIVSLIIFLLFKR